MELSQIQQVWAERGLGCTVWTDPPGQVWANFIHEVDELVTLVEGEIELSSRDKTLRPGLGEEVFIPAAARHTVRNIGARPIAGVLAIAQGLDRLFRHKNEIHTDGCLCLLRIDLCDQRTVSRCGDAYMEVRVADR